MKQVYFFGSGKADGNSSDSKLLGGKGANLAEMTNIGLPVPPGFTVIRFTLQLSLSSNISNIPHGLFSIINN